MNIPAFSVVIPVFNNWELTRACLQSLREHTSGIDVEVVVADNASSDATARELLPLGEALFHGRFQRLRFEKNRNFGPACNAGARAATAPFVFFLNNDTLPTPNWSAPLLEAFQADDSLGAVAPGDRADTFNRNLIAIVRPVRRHDDIVAVAQRRDTATANAVSRRGAHQAVR